MRSGQLGSVPAPAASRAREFNPGHAPHHRGIGVTPPGLGRENPGGLGGPVCAAGRGCSPLRRTKGAPGGQGGNASGSFRRAVPVPSQGVGGLEPANRHCAGMARMPHSRHFAGMARGPLPQNRQRTGSGAVPRGPARSLDRFPVLSRRPVLAQMRRSGGAIVMAIGASSPAWIPVEGLDRGRPGRAERGRGMAARGADQDVGKCWYPESKVEAWQLGGDLRSLVGRSAGVPSLARASTRRLEFSRPTVTS